MLHRVHDFFARAPVLSGLYSLAYLGTLHLRSCMARVRGREPLIVFQMGKVGSSTVLASLRASGLHRPLFHVHFLSAEGRRVLREVTEETWGSWRELPAQLKRHQLQSRFLARWIARRRARRGKLQVVTLVRDPIATNASCFFQDLTIRFPSLLEEEESRGPDPARLVERFFDEHHHELPLTWFHDELQTVFGIDVLASEFPRSKGYGVYRSETVEVLLLRLEDLARCAAPAFSEFLGLDRFVLVNDNVASDKPYADAYRRFRSRLEIPDFYLRMMYDGLPARHFYTDEEIESFKANWKKPAA